MKAEQIYYTSCEFGYENSAGFQIKAISNGLEKYISEYKKIGGYVEAKNLPTQPTKEEIETLFPVSFKYKKIDDKFMFIRTAYVGQDFTSRFGNFFMHGLMLDSLTYNPIDIFYMENWKSKDSSNKTLLEPLDIKIDKKLIEIKLIEYISELTNQDKKILQQIIASFFIEDNKLLFIKVKNANDNIKWLTLILKLFPSEYAKNITFSSYQYSFTYTLDINITYGDTELKFDENDLNYYNIFDFEQNLFSDIDINLYANNIIELVHNGLLNNFFSFVEKFDTQEIMKLNDVMMLYLFIQNSYNINNNEDDLFKMIDLIAQCSDSNIKSIIIKHFISYLNENLNSVTNYQKLLRFYLSVEIDDTKGLILKLYYKLYLNYLFSKISYDEFEEIEKLVNEKIDNSYYLLSKMLYTNANNYLSKIKNSNIKTIEDFLNRIYKYKNQENLSIQDNIIKNIIINLAKYDKFPLNLLSNQNLDSEELSYILYLVYTYSNNKNKLVDFYIENFEVNDKYFETLQLLQNYNLQNFILSEFKQRLINSHDKEEFFNNYIKVYNKDILYKEYFNILSNAEKDLQLDRWKENIEEIYSKGLKNQIILYINSKVRYDNRYIIDDYKSYLNDNIEELEFANEANRFFLNKMVLEFDFKKLDILKREVNKLSDNEYITYLNSFYTKNLNKSVFTTEKISKIFDSLNKKNYIQLHIKTICEILKEARGGKIILNIFKIIYVNNNLKFKECLRSKVEIAKKDEKYIATLKEYMNENEIKFLNELIQEIEDSKKISNRVINFFNKFKKNG